MELQVISAKKARWYFGLLVLCLTLVTAVVNQSLPELSLFADPPETVPTVTPTITPVPTQIHLESTQSAKVIKVVDGDTLKVVVQGQPETVRVIGLDTPETVDPRKPVQCFGKAAAAKMTELVGEKEVVLVADPTQGERDKYQRLLRFVFLPDGTDVGLSLIQGGYAYEYTYQNNPYAYQVSYKAAEVTAQQSNLGLWNSTLCPPDL
jgi:micrococcal nuclease